MKDQNQLENSNSYLGFTDSKSPMQAGKIEKALEKTYRYNIDGKYYIMQRRDAVLFYLRSGEKPFANEYIVNGKSKKEYSMKKPGDNYYFVITKTEYDFANYLISNDLVSEEKVNEYINQETRKREESERLKREAEEAALQEEMRIRQEKEDFKVRLKEEASNYHYSAWMEITEQIFKSIYGEFAFPERAYELLVCIEKIDEPLYKEELKNRLHYDNSASRKIFFHCTGLKLPNSNRDMREFIDRISISDFTGTIPYRERKQPGEKEKEVFYILTNGGDREATPYYESVVGEKVEKYGIEMFIHRSGERYTVSSAECGLRFVSARTKSDLMDKLKEIIDNVGEDKVKEQIKIYVNKFGLSPYYS